MVTQQVEEDEDQLDTAALEALLLVVCLIIKLVVFISAWVIVFESLGNALRMLDPEFDEEVVVTAEEQEEEEEDEYSRPGLQDAADTIDGRSPDEPKTMAEAVGDQAKKLLLTRFRNALVVYVFATISKTHFVLLQNSVILAANVLPVFIGHASVQTIQSIIIAIENVILYLFVGALAIIFR